MADDLRTAQRKRYNLRGFSVTISPATLHIMAEDGPPAAKRKRYNLRSSNKVVAPPDPKRKLPSTNRNFMDLNDYCLLELLDHLRPIELRSVSRVNVRLNDLVLRYVRLKARCIIQPDTFFDFKTVDGRWMTSQVVHLCFTVMGNQIHSLKFTDQWLNIYSNISSINPYYLSRYIKEHCSNVISLLVENMYSSCESLLGKFSGLEELRLKNVHVDDFTVVQLLRKNCTLKKLSVVNGRGTSTLFFKEVCQLRDLEEFEFKKYQQQRIVSDDDLSYLLAFKKLKVFKFGFAETPYSVVQLLNGFSKNGIQIEHLELDGCIADGSAEAMTRLKTIKILKLNRMNGLIEAHVVQIAKELPLLEVVHVRMDANVSQNGIHEIINSAKRLSCLKIDAMGVELCPEMYHRILRALQDRPAQIKLELWIYGNGFELSLPDQTPNEQWLVVHQLNRNTNDLFEDLTLQWQQYVSNRHQHLQQISGNNGDGDYVDVENESGGEDEDTESDSDDPTYEISHDENVMDYFTDESDIEDDLVIDDDSGSEDNSGTEGGWGSENEQTESDDSSN